jgi:hypothetical protein
MFNWLRSRLARHFAPVRVALGDGHLDRYTLFECKRLFSVYLHVFNTVAQDRFHSHAFSGVAVVLRGGYWEEYRDGEATLLRWVGVGPRYIPRAYCHRLLRSEPGSVSVLFAGPWAATWTEEKDGCVRTLAWGRKEVNREYRV